MRWSVRWMLAIAGACAMVAGCSGDRVVDDDAGAARDASVSDGGVADASDDGAVAGDGGAWDGSAWDGGEGTRDAGRGDASDDAATGDAAAGDAGASDAGPSDAGAGGDAAASDAGSLDAGASGDAGASDAGPRDAGPRDAGPRDAGPSDAGPSDAGPADAGPRDAGPPDGGGGGCISGAVGTHAVRFRWEGSGPSSTAYVRYELNTLPDTSRWRVTAASSSIGYRPVYTDTFLGEGGLELSGTVFIDVELSTSGLSSIDGVTIAIYGRSFDTTASGSFTWQTFDGTGASPYGGVANSAPYEWYLADATAAFSPGDDGARLRLRAGPPSGALVVGRVEICFDAR